MADHEHCFHTDEYFRHAIGIGMKGDDYGYCCHCGMKLTRPWESVWAPIEGHGRHAAEWRTVYGPPVALPVPVAAPGALP